MVFQLLGMELLGKFVQLLKIVCVQAYVFCVRVQQELSRVKKEVLTEGLENEGVGRGGNDIKMENLFQVLFSY